MHNIHIAGTGLWYPKDKISNEELVNSYNLYVDNFNKNNSNKILEGLISPMELSSEELDS